MGKCMFCKTFSRKKVVSRVVKLSNFGLLEELYIQCNQDASKLYSMLFYNHEQGFEQHFPSSLSRECVTAKQIAVDTCKDKSIPRWLPKNPESSSSPSRPNPTVIGNDGDLSFWANGKRNGLGKMVYSNGEVYYGEWLADFPYPAS